jgi:hypothetical protein
VQYRVCRKREVGGSELLAGGGEAEGGTGSRVCDCELAGVGAPQVQAQLSRGPEDCLELVVLGDLMRGGRDGGARYPVGD